MIFAVKLKMCEADVSILGVTIGKTQSLVGAVPNTLLEFDKSMKIDFYHTILPLHMAICLWVEGSE